MLDGITDHLNSDARAAFCAPRLVLGSRGLDEQVKFHQAH
jgi:hypothetical protein